MPVPTVNAFINFGTGPSFAQAMIIGQGIIGTNILADNAALIVDVSNQVDGVTTRRGRNAEADQFQTGTCTLRIVDQNGDFNPMNTAGPYYGLLDPMRKVEISATHLGITYPIFSGFITGYDTLTPQEAGVDVVYTTITAVDAFRLLQNAQITTVAGTSAGQLSGARINNLLDQVSWPASMRDVDAGLTTMQADPGTQRTALAACQVVSTSEYGAFYVDASGSFVFQDRALTSSSIGGTATVLAMMAHLVSITLMPNGCLMTYLYITRQISQDRAARFNSLATLPASLSIFSTATRRPICLWRPMPWR
jgi:hypothetical protein